MDLIDACRKLIAIDSTPGQGNRRLAECAAQLCRERGLSVEIQEEATGDLRQANIIIRPFDQRPQEELLLQTHLDTPDPGPFGLWTMTGHNPFDAHIIDGRIYGLGAADAKLDFLCKLEAICAYQKKSWCLPPVLVGTFGEETGMSGTLKLIRKNKISAKKAFIGEPSNLKLITAGKGFASVEIHVPFEADEKNFRIEHNFSEGTSSQSKLFHGKAAHSSVPHLGESAVKKMFDYLLQLPEDLVIMEIDGGVNFNTVPSQAFLEVDAVSGFKFPMAKKLGRIYRAVLALEEIFAQHRDPLFMPESPTLNIGLVRTGEENVTISGTCRMSPLISTETYESWMRRLEQVCQSVGATFRVNDYKKPYQTDANSSFVKAAREEIRNLGLSDELHTQSSTNEASLFSRVGIECLSFGPGVREGNIHTPTENVAIDDLKMAVEFYKRVIGRFCQ
jgi:succinyl-diaminopimelate desuccinylase